MKANWENCPKTPLEVVLALKREDSAVTWFPSFELVQEQPLTFKSAHNQKLSAVVSMSKTRFAIAADDGLIKLWDERGQTAVCTISHHQKPICALQYQAPYFVSADRSGLISCWTLNGEVANESFNIQLADLKNEQEVKIFADENLHLAIASQSGQIVFTDKSTIHKEYDLHVSVKDVLSNYGRSELYVCTQSDIHTFNMGNGERIATWALPVNTKVTNYAFFGPHYLLGYDSNNCQTTWRINLSTGACVERKAAFACKMNSPLIEVPTRIVPFSYQHAALVSSAQIKILDVNSNQIVQVTDQPSANFFALDHGQIVHFSNNDKQIVVTHRQPHTVAHYQPDDVLQESEVVISGQNMKIFAQVDDWQATQQLLTGLLVKRGFIFRTFSDHLDIGPVPNEQQEDIKKLIQKI